MSYTQQLQPVLKEYLKLRTPVFISSNGLDIAFQTYLVQVDPSTILLENLVRPEFIAQFSKGTLFFLQCKLLRLQTSVVYPKGTSMAFEIQDNSVVEETRQSERHMFTPEERVIAEILNPFDKTTKLRRHVMDMSATGLSIRINEATKPFLRETILPDVKVSIDQKLWTKSAAEVVYNRKFLDLDGHLRVQVGLKFIQPSP